MNRIEEVQARASINDLAMYVNLSSFEQEKIFKTLEAQGKNAFTIRDEIFRVLANGDQYIETYISLFGITPSLKYKQEVKEISNQKRLVYPNNKSGYTNALQLALISGLIGGSMMIGLINIIAR